jgi:ubiquitin-like 1-activating enzyme E1 A
LAVRFNTNISLRIFRNRILAQTAATELSPVCAIVGGILAQEIIKVLSGKELPVQNWFLYDGISGSGLIHHIEEGKPMILQ